MAEYAQLEARPIVGRYALHDQIGHGGTATIHVGRLVGPVGFTRTVAIKRLHGSYASDPTFVAMFMDEARLAARIRHPNVVSIIDVVAENGELLLVMDYVHGESLAELLAETSERGSRAEPHVCAKIMTEVLSGLHAAHELTSEEGEPLGVVHRDVSPQNVLVAADGVAHIIDFGIAKAVGRAQHTQEGQIKGKLRYMAPEQIECGTVDRRTDLFAAAVVLWEALVGRFLFNGNEGQLVYSILSAPIPTPSAFVPGLPKGLEAVVMKGLERNPERRFRTALEMADALEAAVRPATSRAVARWVEEMAAFSLQERARLINEIELGERSSGRMPAQRGSDPSCSSSGLAVEPRVRHVVAPSRSSAGLASKEHEESSDFPRAEPEFDPAEFEAADSDASEPSALERHTMPLPIEAYEHQSASAVHLRDDSALASLQKRRLWHHSGLVMILLACSVAVATLAWWRMTMTDARVVAPSTNSAPPISEAPDRESVAVSDGANTRVATPNGPASQSEPRPATAGSGVPSRDENPATSADADQTAAPRRERSIEASRGETKARSPRAIATKPSKVTVTTPTSTESSSATKRNSLYVRD